MHLLLVVTCDLTTFDATQHLQCAFICMSLCQDLAALGLAADPNLYLMANQAGMCRNAPFVTGDDDLFGGDELDGSNFDLRIPAVPVSAVTSPHSWSGVVNPAPGLTPPPQLERSEGSQKGRSNVLSPSSNSPGRHALRPGLQSAPTTPSMHGATNGSLEHLGVKSPSSDRFDQARHVAHARCVVVSNLGSLLSWSIF
eukprot:g9832.t1